MEGRKKGKPNRGSTSTNTSVPVKPPPGLRGKELSLWYASQPSKKLNKRNVMQLDIAGINVAQLRHAISLAQESVSTDESHTLIEQKDLLITDLQQMSLDSDPLLRSKQSELIRDGELDSELQQKLTIQQTSPAYRSMLNSRKKLPIFSRQKEITDLIESNQVMLISGETGCGKTTQVPQFLLEHQVTCGNGSVTRVIVTQPRRISAISVAERVAAERGERLGVSVGYQVRLERCDPKRVPGSIMYLTTGMLLQWLHSDPLLQNISHVIVDEIHEREVLCDFLLTMLRNIIKLRPELHVIMMSATMNAEEFSAYFGNCSILEIPGRVFPVETFFLEDALRQTNFWLSTSAYARLAQAEQLRSNRRDLDVGKSNPRQSRGAPSRFTKWLEQQKDLSPIAMKILHLLNDDGAYPMCDLIVCLVNHILQTTSHGAVLVFVPGIGAIRDVITQLQKLDPKSYTDGTGTVHLIPLHSQISLSKQRGLFDIPPVGQRKVIVATNIAETSITIEDVVYVIDCGRVKQTNYDPLSNTNSLAPVLVSRSNALQRCGRAGRTQPGVCYHLFSKYVFENNMADFTIPEMLRMRLEDVILRIKFLRLGPVSEFLASCPSSPDPTAVERTLHFLHEIQALRSSPITDTSMEHTVSMTRVKKEKSKKADRKKIRNFAQAAKLDWNNGIIEPASDDVDVRKVVDEPTPYVNLTGDHSDLTALGENLALLPLDAQLAKLLILGAVFGCLEPMLAVATCLGYKDPFEMSFENQKFADQSRLELSQNTFSDHWVYVTLIRQYRLLRNPMACREFCEKNFVRQHVIQDILRLMRDHANLLYERRYLRSPDPWDPAANVNSDNLPLFRAILCGAFFPNVIKLIPNVGKKSSAHKVDRPTLVARPSEGNVYISPRSLNNNILPTNTAWMVYFSKTRMDNSLLPSMSFFHTLFQRPTIMDTTVIPLRAVLLFSGCIQPQVKTNNKPTASGSKFEEATTNPCDRDKLIESLSDLEPDESTNTINQRDLYDESVDEESDVENLDDAIVLPNRQRRPTSMNRKKHRICASDGSVLNHVAIRQMERLASDLRLPLENLLKTYGLKMMQAEVDSDDSEVNDVDNFTNPNDAIFSVDDWIHVRTEPKLFKLITDLHECLDKILEKKFLNPSVTDWSSTSTEAQILRTIINLLSSEPIHSVHAQSHVGNKTTDRRGKSFRANNFGE